MDPTLKALLDAHERLDATAPTDRVDVLEVLCHELPRLLELTPQEWAAKLAHIQDDLYDLGQQAERAGAIAARLATQHEQAERGLATLEAFAARRTDRDNDSAETTARVERRSDRDLVGRLVDEAYAKAALEADSTREAVLIVMRSDASRGWTPQAVHDELRRLGRTTARTSIQTFLQRSVGKEVRRKGSGVYELEQPTAEVGSGNEVTASVSGPRSSDAPAAADTWLTEEVLQRVAAEAQSRFLATHPGEADPDELVQEAKRRVAVWIARHHQEPYDEAHLRRLMKTAIDDRYRRSSRNGSTADHDEERDEVSP